MLVTVDIGNTNITIGIFDKEDLIGTYRLTTKVRRTSDEYGFMLKNFLDRSNVHEKQIEAVIAKHKNADKRKMSAQDSIPFQRMFPDGICRTGDNSYTEETLI